jgi:hypothetical protein
MARVGGKPRGHWAGAAFGKKLDAVLIVTYFICLEFSKTAGALGLLLAHSRRGRTGTNQLYRTLSTSGPPRG